MDKKMLTKINKDHNISEEDRAYYFYNLFVKNWDENELKSRPGFKVIFLDQKNDPFLMWSSETSGIDAKEVLEAANKENASGIVLAKSDPSDDVEPDRASSSLLEEFKKQSREFSIRLRDFIILSKWSYHSFLENRRI